jgi:hypothetical protein
MPNELSLANNRAVLSVNGVRDRLKVLLVSGQPHLGERTWRNLLKSDHDPSTTGEERLHPLERARLDLLPDPRAVRGQAARV